MSEWRRIKLKAVGWLCFDAPAHLRWKWVQTPRDGRQVLQLISPRGTVWDFKLGAGAWIKKAE